MEKFMMFLATAVVATIGFFIALAVLSLSRLTAFQRFFVKGLS